MTTLQQLILISIGKRQQFDSDLTGLEWRNLYAEAEKHSLVGICFAGIEKLPKEQLPDMDLLMDWLGQAEYIKCQNEKQNERTAEVTKLFQIDGLRTCILKGQGIAQLYPHPELRQCGDIDVWVDASREHILEYVKGKGYEVESVVIHHADVKIFDDTPTEIHFLPSYSYSPFRYRKYILWFWEQARVQFCLYDNHAGYTYPSLDFNAVYLLLHIFRHVFNEGIGLRQLMDYYYVLNRLVATDRTKAMKTLQWLGLGHFTASIMYVMKEMFMLEDEKLLCPIDEKAGRRLLNEIMIAGNFGKYDDRVNAYMGQYSLKGFAARIGRLLQFVADYPSEVLWSPFWKLWHTSWLMVKGYKK